MGRRVLGLMCFCVLVLWCVSGRAEIPQVISYQGKVTDASGNPVANGNYPMRFRIYNVVSGDSALWDSGARTVAVAGGVFSVLLGESPQPSLTLDFSQDYWLAVSFSGVDQTPRQRLASTGYAYMASGLVAGTEVSGSVMSGMEAALYGWNTATSGFTYGVRGESASTRGRGVYGYVSATSGTTYGGRFESVSTAGIGVYGYVSATSGTTYGVVGWTVSTGGRGVDGYASATSGFTYGVRGESASTRGRGVYGYVSATSGTTYGGRFESVSSQGRGVYGHAIATSGYTYGVWGQSASTAGMGVYGEVPATTGTTYGVWGQTWSPAGHGVYGHAIASTGECFGGRFQCNSTSGSGVFGHAYANSGTTYGVYGMSSSPSGHGVYYSGGLAGSGNKSCVVKTSKGPTLLYCQESPENWFEDFGEGTLVNGRCHIELDPVFLETVTIDAANPMKVFVEFDDEKCAGAAVKRGATGFYLVERLGGTSSCSFWYRVAAKRKGFEARRLDMCEAARTDSYLYPELREKELRELQQERIRHDDEHARVEQERARMEAERLRQREAPE